MKKFSQLISIMIIIAILLCSYQALATEETIYKTDTNIILSGEPMQYNNSPYYIGIEKETENILILNKLDINKHIWAESTLGSIEELNSVLNELDIEGSIEVNIGNEEVISNDDEGEWWLKAIKALVIFLVLVIVVGALL